MSVLLSLALGLIACTYACLFTGRIPWYRAAGLLAIACSLAAAGCLRGGVTVVGYMFTAKAAYFAWWWWKGGGDDDIRRGRRRIRRLFTPVRRTAPSAA
ncbi:hypothetical protein [Streptomyces sp. NPDC058084]|uniref:hypothetical protein n=1 Tax=Streptomyces sp. NPDC058084 TaxID=3346333 RepID=UPI0036ED6C45